MGGILNLKRKGDLFNNGLELLGNHLKKKLSLDIYIKILSRIENAKAMKEKIYKLACLSSKHNNKTKPKLKSLKKAK